MFNGMSNKNKSALILYLCNDNCFRQEAINKLVFFVDLISFVQYSARATDFTYRRLPEGAFPVEAFSVRNLLVKNDLLREVKRESPLANYFYYTSTRNVDFGKVTARLGSNVTSIADLVIRALGNKTISEFNDLFGEMKPWAGADWDEILSLKLLAEDPHIKDVVYKHFNLE